MTAHSDFQRWQREERDRTQREARVFIAGFWAGLIPGMLVAVACVLLSLFIRG